MIKRLLFLAIVSLFGLNVQAQLFPPLGGQRAGISALTFLKMDLSPRSAGLGGANLTLSGDGYSVWTNPAALAETKGLTIGVANTFWAAGTNAGAFSIGKPTKAGHLALSMSGLSSGAMEVRTEFQPNGTGELFYASYFSAGLTYSKQLTDYFRYGISLKYVREQVGNFAANTAALDLGFLYRTEFNDLSFAVQVQNFGLNSVLRGDLPDNDPFFSQSRTLEDYPAPTVFQLAVSMIPWKSADEKQTLTTLLQLNHPNDNAENLRFGLEYAWRELLFLRAGYKLNVVDQNLPTAGFGLRSRIGRHPLRLDYAFDPSSFQGVFHRIGLAFSVNSEKR
ncbi:MAG: PorV/PorQ family protein [Bacteroidia bacterium]